MRLRIMQHTISDGARKLADSVPGLLRLRCNGVSTFTPRATDYIINWGCNDTKADEWFPTWRKANFLNLPNRVAVAQSKTKSLEAFKEADVSHPEFTTDPDVVRQWFSTCKHTNKWGVIGRKLDCASSGRGIYYIDKDRFANTHNNMNYALFTKYMPKFDEYRVHVFGGVIIDAQQKKRQRNVDYAANLRIRTHTNGWIFAREGIELPEEVANQALKAVEALGLDFGAVDIGWARTQEIASVYEVNTAPGLDGTTIMSYANAFKGVIDELRAA